MKTTIQNQNAKLYIINMDELKKEIKKWSIPEKKSFDKIKTIKRIKQQNDKTKKK